MRDFARAVRSLADERGSMMNEKFEKKGVEREGMALRV
jgi:hypothetical protein